MARKSQAKTLVDTEQPGQGIPPIDITADPAPGAAPEPEPAVQVTPQQARGLYVILGELEIWLAAQFFKIPSPIARQVFEYKPDELDTLADPTAAVLSKYAPRWLSERSDEVTLLLLLAMLHQQKFSILMVLMQQQAAPPGPQPAPPADVIDTPVDSEAGEGR